MSDTPRTIAAGPNSPNPFTAPDGRQASARIFSTPEGPKPQLPLLSLRALKLRIEALSGLSPTEVEAVDYAAQNYLAQQDQVVASKRVAKGAAAEAKRFEKAQQIEEKRLVAEVGYLIEEARIQAEKTGVPIDTVTAIHSAIKLARTARQRLSLLLRLQSYQSDRVIPQEKLAP